MNRRRPMTSAGLAVLLLAIGPMAVTAAEIEPGLAPNAMTVLTINLKQLLHAPALKRHGLRTLQEACRKTDAVRQAMEALGFDPFRDLDRLTAAAVKGEKQDAFVYILHGRFDTARFHAVAGQLVKQYPDRLAVHKADGRKYYSVVSAGEHGSVVFGAGASSEKGAVLNVKTTGNLLDAFGGVSVTLLDKNTLIAASSEELVKQTCNRIAGKGGEPLNKPMRRLLTELDDKQTIVFAMRPTRSAIGSSEAADRGTAQKESGKSALSPPSPFVPPPPALPSDEARPESNKSSLCELSGGITLAEDFQLRCTLRTASASDAKDAMKGFKELRLRMGGLATLLAGSSKDYAFLKEIPHSFLAVRKDRIILIEGHLSAETLDKLFGAVSSDGKSRGHRQDD